MVAPRVAVVEAILEAVGLESVGAAAHAGRAEKKTTRKDKNNTDVNKKLAEPTLRPAADPIMGPPVTGCNQPKIYMAEKIPPDAVISVMPSRSPGAAQKRPCKIFTISGVTDR
jgi:hypothetical protein